MLQRHAAQPPNAVGFVTNVVADRPDLRDRLYSPSLRGLPAQRLVDPAGPRLPPVRDQESEGTCTAMALANVIEILRLNEQPDAPPVSPRMLFELAKAQQAAVGGEHPAFHSLRPIIKAFYHNGVCLEGDWPYRPCGRADDLRLTVERAKAARNIILGAYFRVAAYLDDYHAAVNETGAVLVAANTHANWAEASVRRRQGRILPATGLGGGHAFVLIGYDSDGFLILNSWGKSWGGFAGRPGVAHWAYEDWADSVVDAWVLRLAVPTPHAFALTLGENGVTVSAFGISRSPRRAALTGHYAHLDDGRHVGTGSYPSSRELVEETARFLAARAPVSGRNGSKAAGRAPRGRTYDDLLIRFTASSQDLDHLIREATASLEEWKRGGIYPFWLFCWNRHSATFREALSAIVSAAEAQVGEHGPALDAVVEERARGLGRAVWRDFKESARRAMAEDGDGYHLLRSFAQVCAAGGARMHLLSEGEGVFPLAAFLATAARTRDLATVASSLASLTLVAPTCTLEAFATCFSPLLDTLGSKAASLVTVRVPSPGFERRMRIGAYGGSYFRLIARAFEDPDGERGPPLLLGAAPPRVTNGAAACVAAVRFREQKPPADVVVPLDLEHLLDDRGSPRRFRNRVSPRHPREGCTSAPEPGRRQS